MDFKTRCTNPIFWVNTFLSIITPILAYFGLTGSDITTWHKLFNVIIDAFKNPYIVCLVGVSIWNNVINPVTKGIKD